MTDTHTATTDGDLDVYALASRLSGGHVADNVEILNQLEPQDAAAVLVLLPVDPAVTSTRP